MNMLFAQLIVNKRIKTSTFSCIAFSMSSSTGERGSIFFFFISRIRLRISQDFVFSWSSNIALILISFS
jgi:hypothetical protein